MFLPSLFRSLLSRGCLGLALGLFGFFNRRRSHCAQPIPREQQGRCGPQRCDGELSSRSELYQYINLAALHKLWLNLQIPTPSPFVLPAESIYLNAKLETLIHTWVSKGGGGGG